MEDGPGRRKGYSRGKTSSEVRDSVRAEIAALAATSDPSERVRGAGDLIAGVEAELEEASALRLRAIAELRHQGLTYEDIGRSTGLSKSRVSRLAEQAGVSGLRSHLPSEPPA